METDRKASEAASGFTEVVREVSEVSIIIKDLQEQAATPDSLLNMRGDSSKAELKEILNNLTACLEELQDLVKRYSSLSSVRKRTWDRIGFATQNVQEIRSRLVFHISALTIYLDGLAGGSLARIEVRSHETKNTLARIEKMLQGLVKEVRMETREPSVLSADETDPWNVWQELRVELEAEGLSSRVVEEYKTDIKAYLSGLVLAAGIDELRLSDNRSIADTMDLPDDDADDGDDPGSTDVLSEPSYSETAEEADNYHPLQQPWKKSLNGHIFEYFLKAKAFGCARAIVQSRELDIDQISSEQGPYREVLHLLATSSEAVTFEGEWSPRLPTASFLEEWYTVFMDIFTVHKKTQAAERRPDKPI